MADENLFNKLVGKYDLQLEINTSYLGITFENAPYNTDPKDKPAYEEVLHLIGVAKYEEGKDYYHHSIGQCQNCGENMETVRMLTKSQLIPVVRYVIR